MRIIIGACLAVAPLLLSACAGSVSAPHPKSAGRAHRLSRIVEAPPAAPRAPTSAPGTASAKAKNSDELQPAPGLPPVVLRDAPEVRAYLRDFTSPESSYIRTALERRERYLPVVEQILEEEGVPLELSNIALLESTFDADAVSVRGAGGLWQLMKPTAASYGLRVSFLRDERFDAEKSTVAAARHLKDLYTRFGDWLLVAAAYNTGAARLDRAIRAAGTRDVFELARKGFLCRETRGFVAKFVAVTLVTRHLDLYGFESERTRYALRRSKQSGAGM